MNLKHNYIIGTHIMFYEIDMAVEHAQSIINAVDTVDNTENVMVDLFFNISEYFEKIDRDVISKNELKSKFISLVDAIRSNNIDVRYNIYENNE